MFAFGRFERRKSKPKFNPQAAILNAKNIRFNQAILGAFFNVFFSPKCRLGGGGLRVGGKQAQTPKLPGWDPSQGLLKKKQHTSKYKSIFMHVTQNLS